MNRRSFSSDRRAVIEITLTGKRPSAPEKKQALDFFQGNGISNDKLAISDYRNIFRWSFYTRSFRKALELKEGFKKARPCKLFLKIKILQRRDWFDKWKRDYHMRPLGSGFMIVPIWEKSKFKPCRRMPVFLDPGSAFGSGYHETTRLMVRLLESLRGKIRDFLDIGTGTGVLAVAAEKLGAQKVVGFDRDKPSVKTAKDNFGRNNCQNGKFFCGNLKKLKLKEKFHIVGANLLSKELLENKKKIFSCVGPGGYLLVSGVAVQNSGAFQKGFHMAGFQCLKILRGRKWTAPVYKKGSVTFLGKW